MSLSGIVQGFAAFWRGITVFQRLIGRQIQITVPRPQEVLSGQKPLGSGGFSFEVKGTLKHLPKDHEIWLLVKDERSPRVWPQGFERVQFNPIDRAWTGRINPAMGSSTHVTIIAAVAPPTSQDLFRYFQKVGQNVQSLNPRDKVPFEPLDRVPVECKNFNEVQARRP